MAVDGVGLITYNLLRFKNMFLNNNSDPEYKAVKDERYPDYPGAVVVQGVNIGERGKILSRVISDGVGTKVKVDLSYIPGEPDPLQVLPCEADCAERPLNRNEKDILAMNDPALKKYRTLFMAADLFNNEKEILRMAS